MLDSRNYELNRDNESSEERLSRLGDYLAQSIQYKLESLQSAGRDVVVYGPDWCYSNPELAGRLHAEMVVAAYGETYALPNKYPESNAEALRGHSLDMYLMELDGDVKGTSCLVDMKNGFAELGRSASYGRTGNSVIQDMRIMDWITGDEAKHKYHTLFTTLRTAPNRSIDECTEMRGGQAVIEHWRKFPSVVVNGFAPLYLKHGCLEQFAIATITNSEYVNKPEIYVADPDVAEFINNWHGYYGLSDPVINNPDATSCPGVDLSYGYSISHPPIDSGLTGLVHSDVTLEENSDLSISDCMERASLVGSPFLQVEIPVDVDTINCQNRLKEEGFSVFGYFPQTQLSPARIMFGKKMADVGVVPTFWTHENSHNPLWSDGRLQSFASNIESTW